MSKRELGDLLALVLIFLTGLTLGLVGSTLLDSVEIPIKIREAVPEIIRQLI